MKPSFDEAFRAQFRDLVLWRRDVRRFRTDPVPDTEYGIRPVPKLQRNRYDAAIVAVAHRQFRELKAAGIRSLCRKKHVLYDVKHVLAANEVDGRL